MHQQLSIHAAMRRMKCFSGSEQIRPDNRAHYGAILLPASSLAWQSQQQEAFHRGLREILVAPFERISRRNEIDNLWLAQFSEYRLSHNGKVASMAGAEIVPPIGPRTSSENITSAPLIVVYCAVMLSLAMRSKDLPDRSLFGLPLPTPRRTYAPETSLVD